MVTVTRIAFTGLVLAVAAQRLFEVRRSRRHEQWLRARGAVERASWQVPVMAALHGAWLVAMCAEVWLLSPPFRAPLAAAALAVFACGQILRLLAMRALGSRWTIRILTLPLEPPVTSGVYRYLRHPNYLGVILEIAALPLVHGAVWTTVIFSAANAVLLAYRIGAEERALATDNGYVEIFGARPRFLPSPLGRGTSTGETRE
jgi:methyltransferase